MYFVTYEYIYHSKERGAQYSGLAVMTCVYMTMLPTIPTKTTTQYYTKADTSAHKITAKTSGITGGLV